MWVKPLRLLAVAALAAAVFPLRAVADVSEYGISSTSASLSTHQAGAHPDLSVRVELTTDPATGMAFAGTREVAIDLPPGLVANAAHFPTCSPGKFLGSLGSSVEAPCPLDSQVGVINLGVSKGGSEGNGVLPEPLYNLPPTEAAPARFGFYSGYFPLILELDARPENSYGFTARLDGASDFFLLYSAEAIVWGVPSDPSHDPLRLTPREALECGYPCEAPNLSSRSSQFPPIPLTTNPTDCGPVEVDFAVVSYALPDTVFRDAAALPDITGCDGLDFSPTVTAELTEHSPGSASGLEIKVETPTSGLEAAESLAPAAIRGAAVLLPEGVSLNAASVEGATGCTEADAGLVSRQPVRFDDSPVKCPGSSRIGDATLDTPLVGPPLEGSLYLATPGQNPSQSLVAVYLVAEGGGLRLKLQGKVKLDPDNGQIEIVFSQLPPQPFSALSIGLKGGPRGLLTTPLKCGRYQVDANLSSWAGQVARSVDSLAVDGPADAPCPKPPFSPSFSAGTVRPVAGAASPLVVQIDRAAGEQHLEQIEATLPNGLLPNLSKVTLCDAASAATGICPSSSRVGFASILSGAGSHPIPIPPLGADPAPIYLAGPEAGAPLSLVMDVPARAGPFDLGSVVLRAAIQLDPRTAQVTIRSQPLPQIVSGVPIVYRRLRLNFDRSGFIRNPTRCEPTRVASRLLSVEGETASPGSRFTAHSCGRLRFQPQIAVFLDGPSVRNGHPGLKIRMRGRGGEANISRLSVLLPKTELLDDGRIADVCSRLAFAERSCPAGSIYGYASLTSPLLDRSLHGRIYLRSSDRRLPDLVASLNGEIALDLVAHVDSVHGRLRATFTQLPDAPFDRLAVTITGGRRGLLVNDTDLCRAMPRAKVLVASQDARRRLIHPSLRRGCPPRRGLGQQ